MNNKLLNAIVNCEMNYEIKQNSFSPIYSDFGLGLDGDFAGIRTLYLHYNRATRSIFEPLFSVNGTIKEYIPRADKVTYKTETAECSISFYDTDCFFVECKTLERINVFTKFSDDVSSAWLEYNDDNYIIFQGFSLNGDVRDPDKEAPFNVGLRVIKGRYSIENDSFFVSPVDGEIKLAFSVSVMELDIEATKENLAKAPEKAETAADLTRAWISETIKGLNVELSNDKASTVFVKAIITLIFNLTKAPGNLADYISSFPNRGGYPTHFMWDSCFQNLAYEIMNDDIAKDSLLQLAHNIRHDGKIPQFLCSTWLRPHDAQPALLGWAAERLYKKSGDTDFVKEIFPALEKNNMWWLTARMTKFGIIKCADGLETGQDNSPRFDNGTVLAVDMNSYLLNQISVTAYFAEVLGYSDKAAYWRNKAKVLNDGMLKYLYSEEKNMFFDADVKSGEKQTLLTTSGFIPLWAGVKIPHNKAKAMIEDYLLNPACFYSDVPFPSVAYTEGVYDSADWWRGPTWMPEAWLMVEVLKQYGFENEYKLSLKKLYNILLNDGVLHELFNSQTGEGMGNVEQGWSAAIYVKLYLMKNCFETDAFDNMFIVKN